MDQSSVILLQLLQISLGNIDCVNFNPDVVDWNRVYVDSQRQGLLGVSFDAISHVSQSYQIDSKLLFKWLGRTVAIETTYSKYLETLCSLTAIAQSLGIRMLVLKGYGCSLNYPVPNHRPCGDIDIFLIDDNGRHSVELSRQLERYMKQVYGVAVEYINEHHSQFTYDGVLVENHSSVLDLAAHKSNQYLETRLESLIAEEVRKVNVDNYIIYLPSVKFNGVHLLRHMANDFATMRCTMRQVLDWSTFVAANIVDWDFVHEIAIQTNMNRFLDALNGICVDYLGYPAAMFPVVKNEEQLKKRVLEEILTNVSPTYHIYPDSPLVEKILYCLKKTKRMWNNRWKYRMVYDESIVESFVYKFRYVFNNSVFKR